MIVVIDAYNFLHAFSHKKIITEKERKQFILLLSAYARKKGHKVVLVFDGGPYSWPHKEEHKNIVVVYSGAHQCADSFIKEYLSMHREKDLLLVSSDGELNRYAQNLSIVSIDSIVFAGFIKNIFAQKHSTQEQKNKNDMLVYSADNSDEIMKQASKKVPLKAEDFEQNVKKNAKKQQTSKQERQLLKKLHKL